MLEATSTITFRCQRAGCADVRRLRAEVRSRHPQRRRPRPGHGRRRPAAAPRPAAENVLVVVSPQSDTASGHGVQRTVDTQRQARLRLDDLRAATWPGWCGRTSTSPTSRRCTASRSARPRPGRCSATRAPTSVERPARRRAGLDVRRHAPAVDVRHGRQRRARSTSSAQRRGDHDLGLVLPAVAQASARPRRRGAVRAHRAGAGVVRRALRRALRPGALRPGLRARLGWRDGELGLRHVRRLGVSSAARRPTTSAARSPRSCCTRWRTCGSATW